MGDSIRLLIVDDHILFRQALRQLLARDDAIEIVGEAANGQQALEAVRWSRPDVVLMDVHMPVMAGWEAIGQIHVMSPSTRILTVTAFGNPEYVSEAIRRGASGYVQKTASADFLIQAIHRVMNGEWVVDPEIDDQPAPIDPASSAVSSGDAARVDQNGSHVPSTPPPPCEALSPREQEVLSLIARGLDSNEIGASLYLSVRTVQVHTQHIFQKLGVHTRLEAVMAGIRLGLVHSPGQNRKPGRTLPLAPSVSAIR